MHQRTPVIPWDWDCEVNIASANPLPVINEFVGLPGLSLSSMN